MSQANEVVDAIRATAEIVKVFREDLIKGGATRMEALVLCGEIVKASFGGGKNGEQ